MNRTKIEYLDYTWNPTHGCSPVSEGCANCWARTMAKRLAAMGAESYDPADPFKPTFNPRELDLPFRLKKPSRIGVSFMGDLFHEDVSDEYIAKVLSGTISKKHIFLLLTKRPERMREFFKRCKSWEGWITHSGNPPSSYGGNGIIVGYEKEVLTKYEKNCGKKATPLWPPSNLWFGVTCENQRTADERIPILLQIPAAVRFVSLEPLLAPVDLTCIQTDLVEINALSGDHGVYRPLQGRSDLKLDWVIVGGESGPGARPMHPEWARSIRDQCVEAGVPFFFKQWGEWCLDDFDFVWPSGRTPKRKWVHIDGESYDYQYPYNCAQMMRVGKKRAGRGLDGKVWDEMPKGGKL